MADPAAPDPRTRVQPPEDFTLRRSQTMATIGLIAGPVSLFVGGIFLGIVGLVCALFARHQASRAVTANQEAIKSLGLSIKRQATIAAAVCCIALVINAVSVALVLPAVLEAVESGDYTSLGLELPIGTITKTWG